MPLLTVIGGAGVFGNRVAGEFASRADVRLRIVGRSAAGAEAARVLNAEFVRADAADERAIAAAVAGSTVVVHAAGPFQGRDYRVAGACIAAGAHYLDLADARGFVCGIVELDEPARRARVVVRSGVSTVPAISSALVVDLAAEFAAIDEIDVALSPGARNPRGSATVASVLTSVGRPIPMTVAGKSTTRTGWGDAGAFDFPPPLGRRRMHSCDAPDLSIFPAMFGAGTVRFLAGLELNVVNYGLCALAAVRRVAALDGLEAWADTFVALSRPLAALGTAAGGLGVRVAGTDRAGRRLVRRAAVYTESDSAAIAAGPAMVLVERLLGGVSAPAAGAATGAGCVSLAEMVSRLSAMGVHFAKGDGRRWFPGP